jgi:glutamate racemase
LSPWFEEGWLESEATDLIIAEYLAPLKDKDIDTLVLGCTHYPLLKPAISRFMGEEVEIICSSEATAKEVNRVVKKLDYLRENNGEKDLYYLTDYSPSFQRITNLFMEEEQIQVEQVDISSRQAGTQQV